MHDKDEIVALLLYLWQSTLAYLSSCLFSTLITHWLVGSPYQHFPNQIAPSFPVSTTSKLLSLLILPLFPIREICLNVYIGGSQLGVRTPKGVANQFSEDHKEFGSAILKSWTPPTWKHHFG